MTVNAYDFPSALPGDNFVGEPWYIRDGLNLAAEALAQLEAGAGRTMNDEGPADSLAAADEDSGFPPMGAATARARIDYAAERLRLLYVGITRAKRELIVTWNTGRSPTGALQPAAPLLALHAWWEARGVERGA
jgi:DNA helicase-2/ATP-dependent DNA helicase PcrA